MEEAKVEHKKFIAEARAKQVLRKDQMIAEIDVSRSNSEEL